MRPCTVVFLSGASANQSLFGAYGLYSQVLNFIAGGSSSTFRSDIWLYIVERTNKVERKKHSIGIFVESNTHSNSFSPAKWLDTFLTPFTNHEKACRSVILAWPHLRTEILISGECNIFWYSINM